MYSKLLTIAIPTYNRAQYLHECLFHLTKQLNKDYQEIDILVSDNCSTDNTQEVVEKYIHLGYNIKYIKNKTNIGADKNIIQCYQLSKTKFVLALGDDDYFLNDSINTILEVIQNNSNSGVIHIHGFKNNKYKKKYIEYTEVKNFIEKINYWITFISGNIINTNYLKDIDFLKYEGSNLSQINVIFTCIFNAPYNIYITKRMLDGRHDISELNYNLFNVFGVNFNMILMDIEHSFKLNFLRKIINAHLLFNFYPEQFIYRKKFNFVLNKIPKDIFNLYKSYPAFWFHFLPIYYMPCKLALNYYKTIDNFFKLFSKLNSILRY